VINKNGRKRKAKTYYYCIIFIIIIIIILVVVVVFVCKEGLLRHTLMLKNSNNWYLCLFLSLHFKWGVVVSLKKV